MYVTNDFIIETSTSQVLLSTVEPADNDDDDDDNVQYVFVPLVVFLIVLLLSAIVYCMSKYRRAFTNFNRKLSHSMFHNPVCADEPTEQSPIKKLKMIEYNYNSFDDHK